MSSIIGIARTVQSWQEDLGLDDKEMLDVLVQFLTKMDKNKVLRNFLLNTDGLMPVSSWLFGYMEEIEPVDEGDNYEGDDAQWDEE